MLAAETALERLPSSAASWAEVERFCEYIGGPNGDPREIDELCEIARQVDADPRTTSIADLLAAIYFNWRRNRWNNGDDAEAIFAIRKAIAEIGRRR